MISGWHFLTLLVLGCSAAWGQQQNLYGPCLSSPCSSRQGSIIIGGFFPIHEWNYTELNCSAVVRPGSGLQRLEAARWAMESLPSVARTALQSSSLGIGYDLRDSCSSETYLRDAALEFINIGTNCRSEFANKSISMVLGAASSSLSVDLTNLLTLFQVPHISYSATADRLDAPANLFYRTVPPDRFQVQAMISLMARFNWSYVSLVYSNDAYGLDAASAFQRSEAGRNSQAFRFCIAASVKLSVPATAEAINTTLSQIVVNNATAWYDNASVVILFLSSAMAQQLLEAAAARPDISQRPLMFVASDSVAGDLYALRNLAVSRAVGLITFEPRLGADSHVTTFLNIFESRTLANFPQLSWYTDYFQALFPNCSSFASAPCSSYRVRDSGLYRADAKISSVIRSVDVAIQAIHTTILTACLGSVVNCPAVVTSVGSINGTQLSQHLLNVMVGNASYQSESRSFLDSTSPYKYTIRNVVSSSSTANRLDFEEIGRWSFAGGLVLTRTPTFRTGSDVPQSRCAEECTIGQFREELEIDKACCWSCRACPLHHFAPSTNATICTLCPSSMRANVASTSCVDLEKSYVAFSSALGGLCTGLACLGFAATLATAVVFYQNIQTPLVVASSRELSTCLLAGFLLSYAVAAAFFAPPSPASCGVQRFGLGLSLSLCFSALLVKTNRISRIFNRRVGVGRPRYTTPGYQIIFTFILVLGEVAILIAWLALQPPEPESIVVTNNVELLRVCKHSSTVGLSGSLAYNLLLLIGCTFYGVKTRKIPENFNEAKYINFSTYTILAVCLAFIPAYLTVRSDLQPAMLVLSLILIITCLLSFLFFPKAFIIVFHPELNVRSTARRKSRDLVRKRVRTDTNPEAAAQSSRKKPSTVIKPSPPAEGCLSQGGENEIRNCERPASENSDDIVAPFADLDPGTTYRLGKR